MRSRWWCGLVATLCAGSAIFLARPHGSPFRHWSAVALWAAGAALWAVATRAPHDERPPRPALDRADLGAVALLIAVAAALILPDLSIYPLEMVGDPVRDGGLFTRWIAEGKTIDVFRWGTLNGFSLVVPMLDVPFYLWFGDSSALSFKAMAALLGIATPPLFFLLARRELPRLAALAAAVLLLATPVFIYYARREITIAWNGPVTVAVLAALLRVYDQEWKPRTFALLGLVAGLAVYFHGAGKATAFAALGLAAVTAVARTCARRQSWRRLVASGAASTLAFFIGLGPLLLATDVDLLFSRGRLHAPPTAAAVFDAYQRSLRVFFDQPTRSWFPVYQPLIPSHLLSGLFAFGLIAGFSVARRRVHLTLLYFVVLLPLTNSALTDSVNGDHRLTPLLPVIAWVMAIGLLALWRASERLRPPKLARAAGIAAVLVAACGAGTQVFRFFDQEQGRRLENPAYSMMYFALRDLEAMPRLRDAKELCIGGNAWVTEQMRYPHFQEGFEFYLPERTVHPSELAPEGQQNEIFVTAACDPAAHRRWRSILHCSPRERFVCPGAEARNMDVRVFLDDGT